MHCDVVSISLAVPLIERLVFVSSYCVGNRQSARVVEKVEGSLNEMSNELLEDVDGDAIVPGTIKILFESVW